MNQAATSTSLGRINPYFGEIIPLENSLSLVFLITNMVYEI